MATGSDLAKEFHMALDTFGFEDKTILTWD
jgi:hypothetical protein